MLPKNNFAEKFPTRGYFKIEVLDAFGNVLDTYEQHNLVMIGARLHFMKLISGGYDTNKVINRLVLGTKGTLNDDDVTPKTEDEGFTSSRTDMFCEATNSANKKNTWDEITFDPAGSATSGTAQDVQDGSNNSSSVKIVISEASEEPSITYIFNIATDAFNGNTNYMKYSEAGLWADDTLIAMRTFKSKAKDETETLRITWSLIF